MLLPGQASGRAGRAQDWGAAGSLVLRSGAPILPTSPVRCIRAAMPFPTMPDPAADLAHEHARRHPERETLELATAGAAKVLGVDHSATKALARAAITMDKVDLWRARERPSHDKMHFL